MRSAKPSHVVIILPLVLVLLAATSPSRAAKPPLQHPASVTIGVLAYRPTPQVQSRWQPLAQFLGERIDDCRVTLHAMSYRDLEAAIAAGRVDFVLTNSSHYLLMTYRNRLSSPLATLVVREQGEVLDRFGGVVFTRADRYDITSLRDLRGHRIAAVTPGSLGGYQAQARELLALGMRFPDHLTLVETGMPHDRAVEAVLAGQAEAGFARTGILEHMSAERRLDLDRLKIVGRREIPGFSLYLSTALYPEWPIAAMPGVDPALARRIAAELLSLPHDGALARQLDIVGFTIPQDYTPLSEMLRALRLPPFDAPPDVAFRDIWQRYRSWIIAGAVLMALVVVLSLRLLTLNRHLRHSEQQLRDSASKWHGLLTALGEGVFGVDDDGVCTFVNPVALQMLGFTEDEVLGHNQHGLFHRHAGDNPLPLTSCPIHHTLHDGKGRSGEDWFQRKGGEGFPVMLTTASTTHNAERHGAVVVFRDITLQQARERELVREATTDPLTGIANRRTFLRELKAELKRFQRFGDVGVVIMSDIDRFKQINDRHGHAVGDGVLRHYAALSSQVLRETDLFGRLGGEEFGILLPVTDIAHARDFADRYLRRIAATPAPTPHGPLSYTVSLGLTAFRAGDDSSAAVLARADAALYTAKRGGRNQLRVDFSAEDSASEAEAHRGDAP